MIESIRLTLDDYYDDWLKVAGGQPYDYEGMAKYFGIEVNNLILQLTELGIMASPAQLKRTLEFVQAWLDPALTLAQVCWQMDMTEYKVKQWVAQLGLPPKSSYTKDDLIAGWFKSKDPYLLELLSKRNIEITNYPLVIDHLNDTNWLTDELQRIEAAISILQGAKNYILGIQGENHAQAS